MGVKGLQSFLKKNHHHFSTVKVLNHTTVVIDGMNLAWNIYGKMCMEPRSPHYMNFVYGSDQVAFSILLREFFDALEQCSIKPIIVFDGAVIGDDTDDKESKEVTIYQRAMEKFEYAKIVKETDQGSGNMLMSRNVVQTFKAICKDLNIECVATVFEADSHIAKIANENNCCVLTNDSDFIVYILKQGFILLDYFDYKHIVTDNKGRKGISSYVFTQQNVCKTLPGLKPENLALLSVLLGNDYVQSGTFDHITNGICNKQYNGILSVNSFTHAKIANLLTWLRTHSLDEAIQMIASQLDHATGVRCTRKIKHLLESYRIESTENFIQKFENVYPNENALDDNKGNLPSSYLMELLKQDQLSTLALDCIFHNTHYIYLEVEDWRLPSINSVTYRALAVLVTILRPKSYTNLTTVGKKAAAAKDALYVCDRVDNHYRKVIVCPLESLDNYGSLEHLNLYTFIPLEPALKKSLLMCTFRFNEHELSLMRDTLSTLFTGSFLDMTALCMMLVKYISLETRLPTKPQFIEALILTMYYYAAQKGKVLTSLMQNEHYGKILLKLRRHEIKANDLKYEQVDSVYRRIVHFVNQLLSVVGIYLQINSFMNNILPTIRLDYFYNSTLIYRITHGLRFKQFVMNELCKDCDTILDVCSSIKVQVHADE